MQSRAARRRSWLSAALVGVFAFTGLMVAAIAIRGERPVQVRPIYVLSGEWAPFVGSGLDDGGPVSVIMKDVLQDAGYEPQLSFEGWAAVDRRTADGSVFGGFPLVLSADRTDRMLVSAPLLDFDYRLYMRSADTEVPISASDLASLRVGGVAGYDYWTELDTVVQRIFRFDTIQQGFEGLESGEIDVFVEGEIPASAVLSNPETPFDSADFTVIESDEPWARSTQQLYFMMAKSKENARAMQQIDESIRAVQQTPEFRAAVASLDPAASPGDLVRLRGSLPGTVALFDVGGRAVAHTPSGVTARVLEWPDELEGAGEIGIDALVKLKLGTGPQAGRILWASLSNVEVMS